VSLLLSPYNDVAYFRSPNISFRFRVRADALSRRLCAGTLGRKDWPSGSANSGKLNLFCSKTMSCDVLYTGLCQLFFVVQQPKSGRLMFEVPRPRTIWHAHSVELPWTSYQFFAKAATFTTHNKHKRRKSIASPGFEPAIPGFKLIQTYALERTTAGTNSYYHNRVNIYHTVI
jgi:hypothetical protein